jgi:hypothetical protein
MPMFCLLPFLMRWHCRVCRVHVFNNMVSINRAGQYSCKYKRLQHWKPIVKVKRKKPAVNKCVCVVCSANYESTFGSPASGGGESVGVIVPPSDFFF